MSHLPRDVEQVYNGITRIASDRFSRDNLIKYVEFWRQKPLCFKEDDLSINVSGYCVALKDVDLIVTRRGMAPFLKCATDLHEIGHILLGHVATLPLTLVDFQANQDLQNALHRSEVTAYDTPREHAAEKLATMLLECITRYEEAIPETVMIMYGYGDTD